MNQYLEKLIAKLADIEACRLLPIILSYFVIQEKGSKSSPEIETYGTSLFGEVVVALILLVKLVHQQSAERLPFQVKSAELNGSCYLGRCIEPVEGLPKKSREVSCILIVISH